MIQKTEIPKKIAILAPEGKLMGGPECDELKSAIEKILESGQKKVVLDFAKVEWANSSGIGCVISCYLTLKRMGGDLKLARPTDRVKYYLHISKLDTIFAIYESVDEAVASFEDEGK